jgi:hypothetical protein
MVWVAVVAAGLAGALWALSRVGQRHWAADMRALTDRLDGRPSGVPRAYDPRELDGLPAPVQRYLRIVLRVGQPLVGAVNIDMSGRFNLSMTGQRWVAFSSHQRVQAGRPGFVWDARMRIGPGLPVRVVDSYVAGEGRLRVAILGLFTVASEGGQTEMDRGEFIRWLAEAAWYPTALLPSQGVHWQAVDACSADATVADGPLSLTMRFSFDKAGLISSIRVDARGAMVDGRLQMLPWEARWTDYQTCHGMTVPMTGEVAWLLPQGRHRYFVGTVVSIRHEDLA